MKASTFFCIKILCVLELTSRVEEARSERPAEAGSQGTAGPVGVGPRLLAQTLQLCLGLGVAKGPERPRRPALGPAVLLLIAGVQAAHVEGAEEAPLRSRVVLHQGFQAGELGWQVLGRGQGRDFSSSPPFPMDHTSNYPTTLDAAEVPASPRGEALFHCAGLGALREEAPGLQPGGTGPWPSKRTSPAGSKPHTVLPSPHTTATGAGRWGAQCSPAGGLEAQRLPQGQPRRPSLSPAPLRMNY